jgi:hypothetical protein
VIARIVFLVTAAALLAGCFGGSDAAEEQQAVETKTMPPSHG